VNPDFYWLILNGEKSGPFSLGEISRRIRAGEVSGADPAWHVGISSWTPLGQIAELREVFDEDKMHDLGTDDAAPYLPPSSGPPPLPQANPVYRRFWARWLDIQTYSALWWLALSLAGQDIKSLFLSPWLTLIQLVPWFLIEAACIHLFATTPGKALLGLRVVNRDGSRLSLGASLHRSFRVLVMGIGLGLGVLCQICQALAWFTVRRTGATLWDLSGGHKVEAKPASGWRITACAVLFITAMQISGTVLAPAMKPVLDELIRNDFPWLRKAYEESMAPQDAPKSP
jgi:uncharacterized RDD family membrane protein YckC